MIIEDVGSFSDKKPDDYPDFAKIVAKDVVKDKTGKVKGILICGSGTGMAMAANKVKGVRAAMVYDNYSAKMARHDNDANIACLRGRGFSKEKSLSITKVFLKTKFSKIPRHKRRIAKLNRIK